jgi:aryl-alcohol dehydrogenase-like predicted oxidoreductase
VSVYTNLEVEDIIQNYREVDFVQAPFNLLDNQQKRKKAFEKLKEKGIEVHTRSVFLQGLFFRAQESLNEKIQPLRPYLEELENIKRQKSISTEKLALQYVLQKDYIDRILIGVETPQQLLQNIANSKNNIYIPHEEINEINVKKKELLNPTNWN